jgi:hypothetical protein
VAGQRGVLIPFGEHIGAVELVQADLLEDARAVGQGGGLMQGGQHGRLVHHVAGDGAQHVQPVSRCHGQTNRNKHAPSYRWNSSSWLCGDEIG